MVQTSPNYNQKRKPSTWDELPLSSSLAVNACSLPLVVPAMFHTTLEEGLLWTRMLKLAWKGTSTRTHLVFRKWVLVHRGSKEKPAEGRINSCSEKGLAVEEALDIHYHCSSAGKKTEQHGATAAKGALTEQQGAGLPSGPFQWGHPCIPSCCFLPALNRSLPASCSFVQGANLASGEQAAQRDACTVPGLWTVLLFPSYADRQVSSLAACPLLSSTALSLALQAPLLPRPLPNPKPQCWDSQVMVSRRSMQHTKSEKPILLAASPYRRAIRRRSCSLAARPAEGRGMTALGTHCGMMDWLWWPCAPCKEAGTLPQPPTLPCQVSASLDSSFPFPRFVHKSRVEWWKIKVLLVTRIAA